ncbi:hypothetical protein ACFFU1_06775 [Algibacter miyuki]|uniref:Uncharacterized protein n=1 Tax=Algibacter miyuki TaxID=1306933 RepID=A0ABV5GYG9_9FLAO|nr:hypothetical protein [Algibacter miyuki]MDN3667208.1 hypothetical protein [Algibacter miyuki]
MMKNYIYLFVLLICGTTIAQEKPKQVKQETIEKTVKYNNGEEITESKLKVISRETSNVELDLSDKEKVNQKRIATTKKVETMVMVDDNRDPGFDLLSKETHFVSDDKSFKFSPSDGGFNIVFDNNENEFVVVGKAWSTKNPGSYIVKGETYNGIGYITETGDFIVEYYSTDSKSIETISYKPVNK